MDDIVGIPDPTDWIGTSLSDFAQFENALHCQICKEFYDTPMITSCSHTFCSKCIRTSLSADGLCPACRSADQASKLRNNWVLQEVVGAFLHARPAGIALARKDAAAKEESATMTSKRKRGAETNGPDTEGRMTRRKSRRIAESSQASQSETIEVMDQDDDDQDFLPEKSVDDGLVECPLGCGKRMKIEAVEPHLDRCEDEKREAERVKSRTPQNRLRDVYSSPKSQRTTKPAERLSELNYSMMKEAALSKRLRDLGIPAGGGKQLMIRRHTEWVNIWNANCDSSHPRSKQELLRDLDGWERTQGGRAPVSNGLASTIMRKDFDNAAWANRNKSDFSRLIADARARKSAPTKDPERPDDVPSSEDVQDVVNENAMTERHDDSTVDSLNMGKVVHELAQGGQTSDNTGQPALDGKTDLAENGVNHNAAFSEHTRVLDESSAFHSQRPVMSNEQEIVRSPYTFSAAIPLPKELTKSAPTACAEKPTPSLSEHASAGA